jgi:uncharacterized protein (DUF58 family)
VRLTPFLPTTRAALLIALAAPVALLIAAIAPGAWVVAPALGVAIFALVAADAFLAGKLVDARVITPADMEVGGDARITVLADFTGRNGGTVEAALALDPRLAPGGAATLGLNNNPAGAFEGSVALCPSRRGTGKVERLWLRWTGPLGLGARQATRDLAAEVRVWPNLAAVRSPALQVFLRDAQFGMIARRIRGEGTDFEALAESTGKARPATRTFTPRNTRSSATTRSSSRSTAAARCVSRWGAPGMTFRGSTAQCQPR